MTSLGHKFAHELANSLQYNVSVEAQWPHGKRAQLWIRWSRFEPWPGSLCCVVFLGKTLYSHSASLHPGVQMGTSKCAGGNSAMD